MAIKRKTIFGSLRAHEKEPTEYDFAVRAYRRLLTAARVMEPMHPNWSRAMREDASTLMSYINNYST
jgi:hypothetical protein